MWYRFDNKQPEEYELFVFGLPTLGGKTIRRSDRFFFISKNITYHWGTNIILNFNLYHKGIIWKSMRIEPLNLEYVD